MTTKWKDRGTRVLTYMSPFFSDPSAYSNSTTAFRHNFFHEGVTNGYFVQNNNGSTYLMYSLSIKFAMLDLTNPAAVSWMQDIIINQSVEEAGSSGWMCDFGEYLPFDAVLHSVSYLKDHVVRIMQWLSDSSVPHVHRVNLPHHSTTATPKNGAG
jgi:alpha-glucosidase (family GH31 glycosyl hydrolase)